jgi:hypothetical protein
VEDIVIITVVAVLSQIATGFTVEQIVTDSDQTPNLSFTSCAINAQKEIAQWMQHSKYSEGWRLDRYKCIPGHYELRGRA